MSNPDLYAYLLFGTFVACILGTVWAVIGAVLQERRIQRSEAEWRAWFAALPETEKQAGAERLWAAVSETPTCDDQERISRLRGAAVSYDDDRPGMMRIHIASRRADALCKAYTRDWLRAEAKRHGISTHLRKSDTAWFLVNRHGYVAPGYDKRTES